MKIPPYRGQRPLLMLTLSVGLLAIEFWLLWLFYAWRQPGPLAVTMSVELAFLLGFALGPSDPTVVFLPVNRHGIEALSLRIKSSVWDGWNDEQRELFIVESTIAARGVADELWLEGK